MPRCAPLLLLVLLAASASSVLLFRFFLTLDGPMHVLHACALKSLWFSGRYATAQLDYAVNMGTLDLSDLLLIPLTTLCEPLMAQACYASAVLFVLGLGAWRLFRHDANNSPALLVWLVPLSFSFIFVMGFLTFLFACGLAMLLMGWWMRCERVTWRTLVLAGLGVLACQATHRIGGTLALLFIGCHECMSILFDRSGWLRRWSPIPAVHRLALITCCAAVVVYKVLGTITVAPRIVVEGEPGLLLGLESLRPLLLFARDPERPFLLSIGCLLMLTLTIPIAQRWRARTGPVNADAILLAAVLLLLAALIVRTPNARLLYLGTRIQTIALLLLVVWAATVARKHWSLWAIGGAVLVVHTARMAYIERTMAGSLQAYEQAMAVVPRLPLHGVSLPEVRDDNWLHGHISALVAAKYEGVFFSPNDHLGFAYTSEVSPEVRAYGTGPQNGLNWLEEHTAGEHPPLIDHIVYFGHGKPIDERVRNLQRTTEGHYFLQWKNAYAEVWVRDTLR